MYLNAFKKKNEKEINLLCATTGKTEELKTEELKNEIGLALKDYFNADCVNEDKVYIIFNNGQKFSLKIEECI